MKKDRMSKVWRGLELALALCLVIDLAVHLKAIVSPPSFPLPVVEVKKPTLMPVVDYITQTGNTVAYNAVNLVARVEGFLNDISFTDGTFIKKDQPLFVIEPEPYLAKVREAKASLAAAQATDAYNKAEYARQKKMYKENATSLNSVEKWLAKSHESDA
ncbi:MAG: efflux transporter periplasmic adaptor subunit, partial [Legionellaceae bacterium]